MVIDAILDACASSVAGVVFTGFPSSAEQLLSFCADDNSSTDAQVVVVRNAQQQTPFIKALRACALPYTFLDGKWGMGSPEGLEQCTKTMLRSGGAFGNDAKVDEQESGHRWVGGDVRQDTSSSRTAHFILAPHSCKAYSRKRQSPVRQ